MHNKFQKTVKEKTFLKKMQKCFKSNNKHPFIFLDSNGEKWNKTSYLFNKFEKIIKFQKGDSISNFFQVIASYLEKGYWIAGYFKYEFGYYLDESYFKNFQNDETNLAWFLVVKNPIILRHNNKLTIPLTNNNFQIKNKKFTLYKNEYKNSIIRIKKYLKKGRTYQVNFTFKEKFFFKDDILSLYLSLRRSQPTNYSAYIFDGINNIISLSPELFFQRNSNKILCKPMKGTAYRGKTLNEDMVIKKQLSNCIKNKAENLMIVDLIRNDLGKICTKIHAKNLFKVETYPSLFQMISEIIGSLKKNISYFEIFKALFPCGSITGAPKLETMKIIATLEKEKRGIYTGAIGYISPYNSACFSVPIRTIKITKNKGELGIGGGITFDSKIDDEFNEALLKADFFNSKSDFSKLNLIETILLQNKKYFLKKYHISRLKKSADFFGFKIDFKLLNQKLKNLSEIHNIGKFRVRIEISKTKQIKISLVKLHSNIKTFLVTISKNKVNSNNHLLYHKTNQREFYENEFQKAQKNGFDEVFFMNEKSEITEGSFTNIFIKKNNILYTPDIRSGILPGTFRKYLIDKKQTIEKTLFLKDLKNADKIYVGNSIKRLIECNVTF